MAQQRRPRSDEYFPAEMSQAAGEGDFLDSTDPGMYDTAMRRQVREVIGDLENMVGELKHVVGGMKTLVHQIDAVTSSIDDKCGSAVDDEEETGRRRRLSEPVTCKTNGHFRRSSYPVFHFFQRPPGPKPAAAMANEGPLQCQPPLEPIQLQRSPRQRRVKEWHGENATRPSTASSKYAYSNFPKMGVSAKLTCIDDFTSTGSRECISTHERSKQSLEAEARRNRRERAANTDLAEQKFSKHREAWTASLPRSKSSRKKDPGSQHRNKSDGKSDIYEAELETKLENLKVTRCHFDTLDDSVYSYGATISSYGTMSKRMREAYREYRLSLAEEEWNDTLESIPSLTSTEDGFASRKSEKEHRPKSSRSKKAVTELAFKEELLKRSKSPQRQKHH